ncbi:alpha/beta fold hydrolase [Microbacterium sp. cf332]|uniref:alpha/beta fold hydrolase n=1 Tax=Microbacterium sp. cf332 TaxID=1761804 RepID=UPI000886EDCC|nr:alpha/beta hydrolase [Microbacterium sp. cf332]SDQ14029.1 Pimeloyl-ACP methyl ester carboxylesterase [Microbacterium sp. cf332]
MPYTDTTDVDLYFEAFGDADAPLVVLISGGGAQLLSWPEPFIELIAAQGFRVVRFDNRDTGLSPRFGGEDDVDGGYGLEELGDDVVRILDHLGVDGAHLVGHSMGGMMAQMAAIRRPGRVLSLGLVSTIPGQDPRYVRHDARPELQQAPVRVPRAAQVEAAGAYAEVAGSARYPIDVGWMRWAAGEAFDRGDAPEGFSRQWAALLRAPERLELLRSVAAPALVFHGRDDDVCGHDAAIDMAAALPEAELQIHPGMGHLIPPGLWPALADGIVRTARRGEQLAGR